MVAQQKHLDMARKVLQERGFAARPAMIARARLADKVESWRMPPRSKRRTEDGGMSAAKLARRPTKRPRLVESSPEPEETVSQEDSCAALALPQLDAQFPGGERLFAWELRQVAIPVPVSFWRGQS